MKRRTFLAGTMAVAAAPLVAVPGVSAEERIWTGYWADFPDLIFGEMRAMGFSDGEFFSIFRRAADARVFMGDVSENLFYMELDRKPTAEEVILAIAGADVYSEESERSPERSPGMNDRMNAELYQALRFGSSLDRRDEHQKAFEDMAAAKSGRNGRDFLVVAHRVTTDRT